MTGSIEITNILKLCEDEGSFLYRVKGISMSCSRVSSTTDSCKALSRCATINMTYRTALVPTSSSNFAD